MSGARIWMKDAPKLNNTKVNGFLFIYAQIHPYYRLVLLVSSADGKYPIDYTILYSKNSGVECGVYTDGYSLYLKKNKEGSTLNVIIPLLFDVTITENQTLDYDNLHLIF